MYGMMMVSWKLLVGDNGVWEELMSVTVIMNILHWVHHVFVTIANTMGWMADLYITHFSSAISNTDYFEYMMVSKMSVMEEKLINKLFWVMFWIMFVLDRMSSTSNPLLHSSYGTKWLRSGWNGCLLWKQVGWNSFFRQLNTS